MFTAASLLLFQLNLLQSNQLALIAFLLLPLQDAYSHVILVHLFFLLMLSTPEAEALDFIEPANSITNPVIFPVES